MGKDSKIANKNIILLANRFSFTLTDVRNINKKILPYEFTKYNTKFSEEFNLKNIDNKEEIDFYDFYHIESRIPREIINKSSKDIEYFIFTYLKNINFFKDGDLSRFVHDTNIRGNEKNLIEEYLKRDIAILKEKNILTSRLAIVLYRKAFLDRYANVTEIGLYYSKEFGSKSKVVDLKKISKYTSVNYDGLSKTKVKAYDLNITTKSESQIRLELEKEIKEHIAKKLLYFTDIDIKTIQRIVELPMTTLKDYR